MIVCFDIGSTLIDGPNVGPARRLADGLALPESCRESLNRLLFTEDFKGPEQLARALSERFGAEYSLGLEVVEELWRGQVEEAYVLPGAEEAVERILSAGFRLAFISNIWPPFYQGFQRCLPELAKSHPAFLSFRLGLAKPDIEIYRLALGELGATPDEAFMVGDTYQNDILPAQKLGLNTIWLLHRPHKEKEDLARILNGELPAPDMALGSIEELYPEHLIELMNR